MTGAEELALDNARRFAARFFLKVGHAARHVDNPTLPLFGLPLILEAEGLIARDLQYLKRCEQAIAAAAREMETL